MRGFSNEFEDFPDYIIKITKQIWEDRGLGSRMRDYYHPDVIVRMPGGISTGEPASTFATMGTLTQFPDRTLLGEDVIWCGDPDAGMLSSHRIRSTATHLGDGPFGPATGRKITSLAIADCYAKDNMISDEWLVRDNGGILRQMGTDPRDWAAMQLEANPEFTVFAPDQDVDGPYMGQGNDNPWGAKLADLLTRIQTAEFSIIPKEWDRACVVEYAGSVRGHSHGAADAFWLGLRSSFPSATFTCHHVMGREDALLSPRAAVRWSMQGTHDGWGSFGAPTGATVHVMGITHAEFGPWGLRREITLFDETAVWVQILKG
ncbi:MAG: nuclear transport factor 2 family protein [Pseudomonadota bacterium]